MAPMKCLLPCDEASTTLARISTGSPESLSGAACRTETSGAPHLQQVRLASCGSRWKYVHLTVAYRVLA